MHTFQMYTKEYHVDEYEYFVFSSFLSQNQTGNPISITQVYSDYNTQMQTKKDSKWSRFIITVDCLAIVKKN